jgi:hypothetical protein
MFNNIELLNNTFINYKLITGELIKAYFKYHLMEKTYLSYVNSINENTIDPNLLKYLSTLGYAIQCGKSYFLNELFYNQMCMTTINDYINTCLTLFHSNQNKDYESATIEEFEGGRHKKTRLKRRRYKKNKYLTRKQRKMLKFQRGGGIMTELMMNIVLTVLFMTIMNQSTFVQSINDNIISKIDITKFVGNGDEYVKNLLESNERYSKKDIEEITGYYHSDLENKINFPEDEIIEILNLKNANNRKLSSKFIEKLKNIFFDSNFLLNEEMEKMTRKLNEEYTKIHDGLEVTCRHFERSSTDLSPITMYDRFDLEFKSKKEYIEETTEMMADEEREKYISSKIESEGIKKPSSVDRIVDLGQDATKNVIDGAKKFFNFFSSSNKQNLKQSEELIVREVVSSIDITGDLSGVQLYEQTYDTIKEEYPIEETRSRIKNELVKKEYQKTIENIGKSSYQRTKEKNIKSYLTRICIIEKPRFEYNSNTGEFSLKNPARSRYHLYTLANNVMTNYEFISKYIKETDYENSNERITKLNNLVELSNIIDRILNEYELAITKLLTYKTDYQDMSVDELYESLSNMWVNINDYLKISTSEFPLQEYNRMKEIELNRETENRLHRQDIEQRSEEIRRQNELNEIMSNRNDVNIESFRIFLEGYTGPVKDTIINTYNTTINSITSVSTDLYKGANTLGSGVSSMAYNSIMNPIWGIQMASFEVFNIVLIIMAIITLPRPLAKLGGKIIDLGTLGIENLNQRIRDRRRLPRFQQELQEEPTDNIPIFYRAEEPEPLRVEESERIPQNRPRRQNRFGFQLTSLEMINEISAIMYDLDVFNSSLSVYINNRDYENSNILLNKIMIKTNDLKNLINQYMSVNNYSYINNIDDYNHKRIITNGLEIVDYFLSNESLYRNAMRTFGGGKKQKTRLKRMNYRRKNRRTRKYKNKRH